MKNTLFLLLAAICFSGTLTGQESSTLTVFSEDGLLFNLLLNGVERNETPKANVKIEGLNQIYYSVKIDFKRKSKRSVEKKELVVRGSDGGNVDIVYVLRKGKKGNSRLELYSVTPIKTNSEVAAVSTPNKSKKNKSIEVVTEPKTTEIRGGAAEASFKEGSRWEEEMKEGMDSKELEEKAKAMLEEMKTETTTTNNGAKDVKIVRDVDVKVEGNTKTTTTTTTTITTIGGYTQRDVHIDVMTESVSKKPIRGSLDNKTLSATGCRGASLTDHDFADSKTNIAEKSTEVEKLKIAKQIASIICLTSEQTKEIMFLFSEEDTKLEFAKFAYDRTSDTSNYNKVNAAFSQPETAEKLKAYMAL